MENRVFGFGVLPPLPVAASQEHLGVRKTGNVAPTALRRQANEVTIVGVRDDHTGYVLRPDTERR